MTKKLATLASFLLASLLTHAVAAAEIDPLFQSSDVLNITLNGPFERIDDDRDKELEYEGSLSYINESGESVVLDAKFTVRGNYRLRKDNCSYAQLWVNLKRGQVEDTIFENQNRLKLVVQCKSQKRYAEYIEREQKAYTMFSTVSDFRFDTRMLNVTYVDGEEDETRTHTGFFIEHQNRLAERFAMEEVELNRVSYLDLNAHQSTVASLFMYLVGNTDYSLSQGPEGDECCHNAKLLLSEQGEYFPIPYDYDASGYVDASYAPIPNPAFGIRNNRDRVYRGYCVSDEIMTNAVQVYLNAQSEIESIVGESAYSSSRTLRGVQRFVDNFFENISDSARLQRYIVDDCRGSAE